jgi:small subunit ribosomal protein S20
MANTKSAKRAVRVIERRTEINKSRRSRLKTMVRNVELALASGDQAAATAAMQAAEPALMRSAQQGVVHKRTASRKVSRLSKRVKALAATPAQPSA